MAGNMNPTSTQASGLWDQFMHSGLAVYAEVLMFSIWGGITKFFEDKDKFTWRNLAAQITSSSFAGVMTSLACQYYSFNGAATGALVGVASYMGTPALIAFAMRLKVVKNALTPDEKQTEGKTE